VRAALRIGLVGCGRVSERAWVPALARSPDARLVGVADVDMSRCAAVAPLVPAFGSAAALVAEGRLDALIVATPPADHLPAARAAAEAGLPCLVEKPPASDALQARELAAFEPAPFIGFNRRFEPALAELRSRMPSTDQIRLALEFGYSRTAWGASEGSGDALLDVGVHLVDLARWLTASDVVGVRAARVEELEAELDLELGLGTASISCGVHRSYRERVDVRDGSGRSLGRYDTGGRLRAVAARLRRGGAHSLVPSLELELEAFAAAARGQPAPLLATAADGLAAMEAIDAAREVSRGG
jgi:myo-inositol 2-dehydrogenase/D-chiro-inositol 1-dehydrogenase